jgi:hypothetical protein
VIPHDLPDYVERGGRQVWRPPYTAREADLFGFVLQAKRNRIDNLLDRDLVEPTRGAVEYRSPTDRIVVAFALIKELASAERPDDERGYIPEREVSVWCLAADVRAEGRLAWFMPYVFVDSGQASASGSEVYGYPKQLGSFASSFPAELDQGGVTTVRALSINPFAPDERAVPREMIVAERSTRSPGAAAVVSSGASAFDDLRDRFGGLLSDIELGASGPEPEPSAVITPVTARPPRQTTRPALPHWAPRRLLSTLGGRAHLGDARALIAEMVASPRLVFLKQFRDATCPSKACYQAVIEAPLTIDPFSRIPTYQEVDPSLFRITLENWASHPIASELGVISPQEPELAFHAKFDFLIQLGFEVWRAPT